MYFLWKIKHLLLKGSYETKSKTAYHKNDKHVVSYRYKHQFYTDKGKTDAYIMIANVYNTLTDGYITVTHTTVTGICIITYVGNCGIHNQYLYNWGMHTSVTDLTCKLHFDAYWRTVVRFVSYDPIFEASATKLGVQLFSRNKNGRTINFPIWA